MLLTIVIVTNTLTAALAAAWLRHRQRRALAQLRATYDAQEAGHLDELVSLRGKLREIEGSLIDVQLLIERSEGRLRL